MAEILLEVCVGDVAGLMAAVEGGADRIELCSALPLGGLTPSAGLMAAAAAVAVPCYAMIRPRPGDFVYTAGERDVMRRDIDAARQAGLAGVVFGASRADHHLDDMVLAMLAGHASGLGLTLHRAIDLAPDMAAAVDLAAELKFDRILTSGGARTALDGLHGLKTALAAAAGRISVMPGAGVTIRTIGQLLDSIVVTEVHSSCSADLPPPDRKITELGFETTGARRTDADAVVRLKIALENHRRISAG